jgi:hypothetical protein
MKHATHADDVTLPLGSNSPPDRDCSEHQIKTAKQPRREVDGCHGAYYKTKPIWARWLYADTGAERLHDTNRLRTHCLNASVPFQFLELMRY